MTDMLDNRYEIIRRLGSGGMADVYLARDTHLGRDLAIKILYKRYANDEEFVARFRQEAQSAAGLNHPHIVSIYDRGQADESYYIAMEYLEGQSLKELISEKERLSPDGAITIAEQILLALQFAHEHEVIHRDIKPHNIIINIRGQVKVTDFGIARAGSTARMTETGSIIGTAQYLSPEQARGKAVEQGSDLYSVGVVLFEMLTGQVPFDGENPVAIALKHLSDDPVPPQALVPEIPDNLNAVVLRALAKDPADRYASAGEFLADLKKCREGLPVAAPLPVASGDEGMTSVIPAAAMAAGMGGGRGGDDATTTMPRAAAASGGRGGKKRKWPLILLIFAAVALAAAGAYLLAFAQPAGGEESEVPRVLGMTRAAAEEAIRASELVPEVEAEEFNDRAPAGTVIRQNPDAGSQLRKNGTVRIVLSKGSNKVAVPNLIGESASFAESKLREVGLSPDRQPDAFSDTVPAGTVISQDPASGTEVEKGSAVRYAVSLGARPPEEVSVPSVTGMDISGARARLEEAKLALGSVTEQSSETVPAGQVISQNPTAGSRARQGTAVNVVISSGPEAPPEEDQVQVPGVVGMEEASAKSLIASRGLVPAVVNQIDPLNDGKVISQSPAEGTMVAPGSTVTIVVGTTV